MIYNPNYNLLVAPFENSFHVSFEPFDLSIYNFVIAARSYNEFNAHYLFLKNYIESYDFSNPKSDSDGNLIDTKSKLFDFIKSSFSFVFNGGTENYFSYSFGDGNFGSVFLVGVFSVIIEKDKIFCTDFSYEQIKLHTSELVYSGSVNTNNKASTWSWANDNETDLTYEVSIWIDKKISKIFRTKETNLQLTSVVEADDGAFELVVVAIDEFGSVSAPAVYNFNLKTSFSVTDLSVAMLDDDGDEINVSVKPTPVFRIYNFNDEYNYILNFDNLLKYSYKDDKKCFSYNVSENALDFTMPDELKVGNHNLNVSIVDSTNNTFGDDILSPTGLHGSHFFFFFITEINSDSPKLLQYYWKTSAKVILSWSADPKVAYFEIYQNNKRLATTVETIVELEPLILKNMAAVITIIPFSYTGVAFNDTLSVTIKNPIAQISTFEIKSDDCFVLENKNYTNNPSPTFAWVSTSSLESVTSYSASIDGSNWVNIANQIYTLDSLQDGEYTFRLKVNYSDGSTSSADLFTYSFTVKTTLPSYPSFTQKTLNLSGSPLSEIEFSWVPIVDTLYYELTFNEDVNFFEKSIKLYNVNSYKPVSTDNFKVGYNKVALRSVSKFNTVSKTTNLTMLCINDYENKKPVLEKSLSSYNQYYIWDLSSVLDESKLYNYSIKKSNGDVFETFDYSFYSNFKNTIPFVDNDVYSFSVADDTGVLYEFFYTYSSYYFNIAELNYNNNKINWVLNNEVYAPYFEYSIAPVDLPYLNYGKTFASEINNLDKLEPGVYKFLLIGYSVDGKEQSRKELIGFEISDVTNVFDKKYSIPNYPNCFFICNLFNDSQSVIINKVVDLNNEEVNCFIQYKKIDDQIYKLYSLDDNIFLDKNVIYDFIINFIE